MGGECPFCNLTAERIVSETRLSVSIRDNFPISPLHSLIIPKRHVASCFELTQEEIADLIALIQDTKFNIDQLKAPDGYNIGINDGIAAGQTVMHLHIHLIPRFAGDQRDPRGGVRWIFPDKAAYWGSK